MCYYKVMFSWSLSLFGFRKLVVNGLVYLLSFFTLRFSCLLIDKRKCYDIYHIFNIFNVIF